MQVFRGHVDGFETLKQVRRFRCPFILPYKSNWTTLASRSMLELEHQMYLCIRICHRELQALSGRGGCPDESSEGQAI